MVRRSITTAIIMAAVSAVSVALLGRGATVQTRDGHTLTGTVDFTAAGVRVTPAGAAPVTVPLADVTALTMSHAAPHPATAPAHDPALPADWSQADLGSVQFPGSAAFKDGVFTLKGSGWGLWGAHDSGHMVMHPWTGDGVFTAHLQAVPTEADPFYAGLTLRQSAADDALDVSIMLHPDSPPHLNGRFMTPSHTLGAGAPKPFSWVRLVRSGDQITGLCSVDGAAWTTVGNIDMPMNDPLVAGLVVTALGNEELMTAQFDHVTLSPGARFPAEGIGLIDGSVVLGRVIGIDASTVTYKVGDKKATLPVGQVAYIFTHPLVTPVDQIDPSGKPSVVLRSGDVMEGVVGTLAGGRLKLDSMVFGPQDVQMFQVVFILLRGVAPAPVAVTTNNGAVYCGTKISMGEHTLSITTDDFGAVTLPMADVWSIKQK